MYILVCDDNREERSWILDGLADFEKKNGVSIVAEQFGGGQELLFRAEDIYHQVDLVYLDVLMESENGFDTAFKLREMGYIGDIVFVCEKIDYVLPAFDYNALNYLIKGRTTQERFEKVLRRAEENSREREKRVIVLSCAGETRAIAIDDIEYFEIVKRIVTVHYSGDTFEFYSTMSKLEDELSGSGFVRTHKSFLVNSKYICKITARNLQLMNGSNLPVGRRYVQNIKEQQE